MSDQAAMTVGKRILMRMFGRPKGSLGRLGGIIMARMNRLKDVYVARRFVLDQPTNDIIVSGTLEELREETYAP